MGYVNWELVMKKILLCLCVLMVGCGSNESMEKHVSEEDYGTVTEVWGCHKDGYGNNSILCNVETTIQKIPNLNLSVLKVPSIGIGDDIKVKTTLTNSCKRQYLCINDMCSLYNIHCIRRL